MSVSYFNKLLFALLAVPMAVSAETYYVAKSGMTTPDAERTFETLEAAYAAATGENDIIEIYEGTYDRDVTQPLIIDRAIEIRSVDNDPSKVHFVGNKQSVKTDCAFKLNHEGAVLKGVTIRNCANAHDYTSYSPALNIAAGTVDYCVISNNTLNKCGTGVGITGGTLKNSVVAYHSVPNGGSDRKGGGIYASGGTIDHCEIFANKAPWGGGIYMTGANTVVKNCNIHDNEGLLASYFANQNSINDRNSSGGGGVAMSGGIIENSVISGNSASFGAGLYADSGTVRNCVFKRNNVRDFGTGALYLNGNKVYAYNNTLIDNAVNNGVGVQLQMSSSFATNMVVVLKSGSVGYEQIAKLENNAVIKYSALPVAVEGEGNILSKRDDFNDDGYPYSASIACLTSGMDLSAVLTEDKDGRSRTAASFGMGAYLYDADKVDAIAISASQSYGTAPLVVTFSRLGETQVSDIKWSIGGNVISSDNTFTHTFNDYGNFEVTLSANNGAYTAKKVISVLPKTTYVSDETGDDAANFPYNDQNYPAKTIQAAIDAVYATKAEQGTVLVAPGTYKKAEGASTSSYTYYVKLLKNVKVKSTVPHMAVLDAESKRQIAFLNDASAVLDGFILEKGKFDSFVQLGAGCIMLFDGTVTNCVIRNGYGMCGGMIAAYNGCITDCVVTNGANAPSGVDRPAGGINIAGPCIVENAYIGKNKGGYGAGIHIGTGGSGAIVRNCIIAENYDGRKGGGGMVVTAGLVDSCSIISNTSSVGAGGIYLTGSGKLRNCVIARNAANGSSSTIKQDSAGGGGVFISGGTMENCTVSQNTTATSPAGVYQSGGTIMNSVIYDNGASNDDFAKGSGGTMTYSCLSSAQTGEGNIAENPFFANPAEMDYTLVFGSPAIDKGTTIADVKTDIRGIARPEDKYDVGAYEMDYSGMFICSFETDKNFGLDSVTVTLTAEAVGGSGTYVKYCWDFHDGSSVITNTTPTITKIFSYGSATVTLTVIDSNDATTTTTLYDVVKVVSTVAYVSPTGGNKWPYNNWKNAAHSIQDAIDAVHSSDDVRGFVYVADGTYGPREGDDVYAITVASPITLIGTNSQCKAVVNARPTNSGDRRALVVNHPEALVANITFTNGKDGGYANGSAGGVWVYDGTVSNCVISKCYAFCTGGLVLHNGLITDCRILNNDAGSHTGEDRHGGGAYIFGGTLQNSVISGNKQGFGGAACLDGANAVLRNCVISNNWSLRRGVVCIKKGLVDRCLIVSNELGNASGTIDADLTGYGVFFKENGGKLQNSIVINNISRNPACTGSGVAIYGSAKGTVLNVTALNNKNDEATGGCDISANSNGTIANCIAGSIVADAGATLSCNYTGDDPKFKKVKGTPYSLANGSPCINTGDNDFWAGVENPVDFLGNDRVVRDTVDIGAVERPISKNTVMILK